MRACFGTVTAESGRKARGWLEVAPTFGASVAVPLGVVAGVTSGPVVAVTAGVHGCEYAGSEAAAQLFRALDPEAVNGTVVVVPVANQAALRTRTPLVNPLDGANLNRVFPGAAHGTVSQRIAWQLTHQVILRSDVVIDLHGGDLFEELVPAVTVQRVGDLVRDAEALALGRAFEVSLVRVKESASADGTLVGEAWRRGRLAVMSEIGRGGSCEPADVALHLRGLRGALRHLGVDGSDRGEAALDAEVGAFVVRGEDVVRADVGGVCHQRVSPGQLVRCGDVVAELTDEWGDPLGTCVAPREGIVRLVFTSRLVQPGAALMVIARSE